VFHYNFFHGYSRGFSALIVEIIYNFTDH